MYTLDFPYSPNVETLFLRLNVLPGCVWLDSGRPESTLGRYDILSALPSEYTNNTNPATLQKHLSARLTNAAAQSELPFCGGWIGYFSYAFRHPYFSLNSAKTDPIPTAQFGWYDWALVIDHQEQKATLVFLATCLQAHKEQILEALHTERRPGKYTCSKFVPNESRNHYLDSLERIREYLLAGDCYQVNYTQRFSSAFSGSASAAYLALRRAVPSPFSAFLNLAQGAILSISPERFIQIHGARALTQPIKGTTPRGKSAPEDQALQRALQTSPKNRAENLMIVDLLRNDFSINCLPHSVRVPQLFALQSFNNVHHLVSNIEGALKPNISHPEFLLACFPGGSITGAPKKRAMEIIEELETYSRSVYCGAIGYFSVNDRTDFNVAIRTLLLDDGKLFAWAGGGIVADSAPDQEYEESLYKIGSLLDALVDNSADTD